MKAGPQHFGGTERLTDLKQCSRCGVGRPVWRCTDCTDKTAVCVLCCRSAHKLELFHRIQKWNGRHYQTGALWQVGVKIYTGHNGSPCPRSSSSLYGLQPSSVTQGLEGDILAEVAEQHGKTEQEVLLLISEALEHPYALMGELERAILTTAAERSGKSVLELLVYLKASVLQDAERDANELQADADRATARAEEPLDETHPLEDQAIPMEQDIGGDDDWEDEDDRPRNMHIPRFMPRPPPVDGAGNKFVTVVHTNGFHVLPIVWCECPDRLHDHDFQLLDLHLYPSSTDRIQTVFTFAGLDHHRYEYLECKSSRYQYHNKLRRLTCPQYPDAARNRYTELGRVARQWRNLKYRKWFWMLENLNGKRGEMSLFCAACPQPGINLPPDWPEEYLAKPSVPPSELRFNVDVALGNFS